MARRSSKRPWSAPHRAFDPSALGAPRHSETGPDGTQWQVQRLRSASKEYTCPGCLAPVRTGSAHVVAWPEEAPWGREAGAEARRHWHTECWRRRLRPR
ncbi:hypothetical protein [Schaalia sp. 19OD2882]|uniref:hypothetical protein n=1 Tax=Schaalia sp. 19OD2882 TaxID=2794089 RepID=UPI0020A70C80|nr:hypothetical protein [Schaalia sp. 19OD2882]